MNKQNEFMAAVVQTESSPLPDDLDILPAETLRQMLRELKERQIALESRNIQLETSLNDPAAAIPASTVRNVAAEYHYVLIDQLPYMVWIKDADSRLIAANQSYADNCGLASSAMLIGKTDLDLWPKHMAEVFMAADRAVIESGQPSLVEELIEFGGQLAWIETAKAPLRIDGKIIGSVGYARNISDVVEGRQSAALVRANEEHLRSFAITANDLLFSLTTKGVFRYISPQVKELFGFKPEEIIGQPIARFIHPDDLPACESFLIEVLGARESRSGIEYRTRKKDGSYRWQRANVSLVGDKDTGLLTFVGVAYDVQKRKEFEEHLSKSEQHHRAIFERSMIGIAEISPEKKWIRVNARLCEILGYSSEELTRMTWEEVTHPDDLTENATQFNRILSGKAEGGVLEKRYIHRDGHTVFTQISARCIRHHDSTVDFIVAMIDDISARKKAEADLRSMTARLEELVAERTKQLRAVSAQLTKLEEHERRLLAQELHDDLGQLLAILKIKLTTLAPASLESSNKQVLELVKLVALAEKSARMITNQLSPPILQTLGLDAALEWLVEELNRSYQLTTFFSITGSAKLLPMESKTILFRCVRELLINVAKHAGVVYATLSCRYDDDRLTLVVSDKGRGFNAQTVLNDMNQLNSFGLSSINERMFRIDGEMVVHSKPGEGSRVTLFAPYSPVN